MKKEREAFRLIVFTAALIMSVIMLHEIGHFVSAIYLGCEDAKIVLLDEDLGTYTQMKCSLDEFSSGLLHLSGFFFVLPFALALLVFNGFERNFSLILLGFNIIISSSDLQFFSAQFLYVSLAAGLFFVIYGENLLINNYIKYTQQTFLERRYVAK